VKRIRVNCPKIFLFLLCASTLLFSAVNKLEKIEVLKGELCLQFKNNCDKKHIKHYTLSKPFRQVFDLKNTSLVHKNITNKLNRSLRVAQYEPDKVRIVIFSNKAYSCKPYQPSSSKKMYHIPLSEQNILPATRYRKSNIQANEKTRAPKQSSSHCSELIVIDAGHGGHDTGAVIGGKREKDVVLQIAKKLEKKLRQRGYPVYMTREDDRFLKLPERTKIADLKQSTAFISIHANSVAKNRQNKIQGVETFFLQKTRDARSRRIAEIENKSVLKGTTQLSRNVILDSVLSGPKIVQSNKLAIDVQQRIITNLRSKYGEIKDGGVRHAPFWVLVGASRPSILVEVGYISHPVERKRLFTPHYQDLIAQGIAEGLGNYLNNRKKEIDF